MALLGLAVGAVFPYFADVLGVPGRHTTAPTFRAACLAAGLVLGCANWLLVRRVVGARLRVLAGRLSDVAATVGNPVATAQSSSRPALDLALPVGSRDDLGTTAAAFNALLAALDHERRFRSVVHATNDVMALLTPTGELSFVSDSVATVLGWTREELLGRHAAELLSADDADLFTDSGAPIAPDGQPLSQVFLVQARHRDGGWRHLEISSSDRRDDPVIGGLLVSARDVTDRLELQQRLAFQATHDALTGLPNRAALLARGAELLTGPARLAVLLMDLDRFKEVNDTLGHSYGDRLLAQVGPRLRPLVRDVDLVARLGGDEFAVLLPDVTAAEACAAAARLQAALGTPFLVDGLSLDVDVSIGVAVSGAESLEIGTLLRQADIAMYTAKERQSGVQLYDPSADDHDRSRLLLLSELRLGLAESQLVVHYQPQLSLGSGRVTGVEALVRWQHPTRGLLGPVDFLPAVERTALIEPLTDAVLDAVLAQLREWCTEGIAVPVSVNLSARSLIRADLPDRVLSRLRAHGVPAAMLRLEVTESALLTEPARAGAVLGRLHAAGVTISIDDFGTGFSAMSHLKHLPVSEIKVDRSYVAEMTSSTEDAAVVRSVIDLGHELGMTVVAEGVEDAVTAEALASLRCDVVQGHLFSVARTAGDVTDWLRNATRSPASRP
ncbi:EAL domain-containing protein [Modestobacter marinus]|uniref:Diguanylate cyclase (GGDEF)-like protein/PAS domain S-box-containing protein n=1 Tax=Modestobacter marinus TaxID=477641 RepID=A0A846LEH6_9ACTN|nr:EAL domain-containing protein [Modestobacter marinus]NIH66037.1 diguanylate cyclase (GGDEF)-like protein/PAS domain S-box-containing protein [Modestobacter marinus]GGL84728.1 two-component system response regulator [Modestobacter marinus]